MTVSNRDMQKNRRVYFLHGLEGSPEANKPRFLKKYYPDLIVPWLPPDIEERHAILKETIREPAFLAGSSLGGLSAVLFAMSFPEKVPAMALFAPAAGLFDESQAPPGLLKAMSRCRIPAGIPTVVIAALEDGVIPLAAIEGMIKRSPAPRRIELIKAKDDHTLGRSLDALPGAMDRAFG
eukprot:NODE_664_length_809_cov_1.575802_g656_i0.p1 GENE.NODE_664_length_809_cov_1.575802_g656_i0~~NODE_664_length_809_cov_1.575802_g656_i0.p1  ORF type:complete len:180 (-),score=54.94 NODE_664_length_809_cov_1.575802_g656_i0:210-749(-)